MKFGICDDDKAARNMVSSWLETHSEITDRDTFEFNCGEALLEHLRLHTLDIVFLDCKMEGLDGIETAKAIRRHDSRLIIILLTDFTDYARFGYGADILNYILKSEFAANVSAVFRKAVNHIKEHDRKTYAIKTGIGLFHLDVADILYVESHGRKKELVTSGGQAYDDMTAYAAEPRL